MIGNELVSGEGLVYTTFIDGREMQRIAAYPFEKSSMRGVYSAAGVRPFTFSKLQLKGARLFLYFAWAVYSRFMNDRG